MAVTRGIEVGGEVALRRRAPLDLGDDTASVPVARSQRAGEVARRRRFERLRARSRSRTCGTVQHGDLVALGGEDLVEHRHDTGFYGASSPPLTVPSHVSGGRRATIAPMERGTIVVVDDEPNIADLVDLYLARDGFRVLKAATGEAGLDAVRDHRPRLVVLDVGLPDIDGLEVCRASAPDVATSR